MMKRSLLTLCALSLFAAPGCVVKMGGGSTDPSAKPNPAESTPKANPDADADADADAETEVPKATLVEEQAAEHNTTTQPGKPGVVDPQPDAGASE